MVEYGNTHWKKRDTHGPQTKFKHGKDLKKGCLQYFEDVKAISQKEVLRFTKNKVEYTFEVVRKQPMELKRLLDTLKIHPTTWTRWREGRDDLKDVIAWAENEIYQYNLEGVLNRHFPLYILNHEFYRSRMLADKDLKLGRSRIPPPAECQQLAIA